MFKKIMIGLLIAVFAAVSLAGTALAQTEEPPAGDGPGRNNLGLGQITAIGGDNITTTYFGAKKFSGMYPQ